MACAWRSWHCDDNNLLIYQLITVDHVYVFNDRLRYSYVWLIINVDAGDDVCIEPNASEMVFPWFSSREYVTTNFSSDGHGLFSYFNSDGGKSIHAYCRLIGARNSTCGLICMMYMC